MSAFCKNLISQILLAGGDEMKCEKCSEDEGVE